MVFMDCEVRLSFMGKSITMRLSVRDALGMTRKEIEALGEEKEANLLADHICSHKPQKIEIWPLVNGLPVKKED